jgi:hypothetical protein
MIAQCVFELYDSDRQGKISLKTIIQILTDNYDAKSTAHTTVQRITKELESKILPNKLIDMQAFIKLSQSNYELLLPTYTAQTQMRRNVLGLRYWDGATKKRAVLSRNRYTDIHIYLGLVSNYYSYACLSLTFFLVTETGLLITGADSEAPPLRKGGRKLVVQQPPHRQHCRQSSQ